jgi:predicted GNAT family N-acyltransferase
MNTNYHVEQTSWDKHKKDLISLRTTVFINEQLVPPDLEWDGYDKDCWHVIAITNDGQCIGTARLLYDGHIGRMAVLYDYRHQGVGSALLTALHEIAITQGLSDVFLHAQTNAVEFYKRHGYSVISDEFMDAGIPHVTMTRDMTKNMTKDMTKNSRKS